MKLFQLTLIFLTISKKISTEKISEDESLGLRGTYNPAKGDFPYMVLIQFGWKYPISAGSGVIYSPNTILTSARMCEDINPSKNARIVAGITKHNETRLGQIVKVATAEIHPSYDVHKREDFEICKITLEHNLYFNKNVQPIKICPWRTFRYDICKLVQFGESNSTDRSDPLFLKRMTLLTMTNDECSNEYKNTFRKITDSMICSGYRDLTGACGTLREGGAMECELGGSRCLSGIISDTSCDQPPKPVISVETTHRSVRAFINTC